MAAGILDAAVDAIVSQDVSLLSVEQLQGSVREVAPQVQRLAGFSALALAELQARTGGKVPAESGTLRTVAGWAAEATSESACVSGRTIRVGAALREALPAVAQAVLDGAVTFAQAQVLTRLVGLIEPQALREAQPHLVEVCAVLDPVQLAAYVRHLIATWVEPKLDDDEASAHSKRYLQTRRESDGSLRGSFRLAAGDAETVLTALEPLARPAGQGDSRIAGQRRADALVEVCEQALRHGELPDAGGQRPQLVYVLPADWAARQSSQDDCPRCRRCREHAPPSFAEMVAAGVPGAEGGSPAEHACATAAWTGPQTRGRVETMLCDSRVSRVLLDSLGQVKNLEALRDSVTPSQRRALAARDLGCAARGCTRPPAMCDAHHLVARVDGGATTLHNLVLLCRRHHVLWHLGKITYRHLYVPWVTDPQATGPPAGACPR